MSSNNFVITLLLTRRPARATPRYATNARSANRGMSLVMVLIILVIASMLGVASFQISSMGERGARNDRDMQLAWQGAEAALIDAEVDLMGPNSAGASRTAQILGVGPTIPESGCATSGTWRGLCNATVTASGSTTTPTWLTVNFTDTSSSAPTIALGTFTERVFKQAGDTDGIGIQPALAPRYVVEDVSIADAASSGSQVGSSYSSAATSGTKASSGRVYRVTAMGFGPRSDIQAVVQAIYRN